MAFDHERWGGQAMGGYGKPLEQNRNNDFRISEYVDRQ
jgi:hypothetical protein